MAVAPRLFIIDASAVLSFLLPDEKSEEITLLFQKYKDDKISLSSSHLLVWEVLNGLRSATLAHRLKRSVAQKLAASFLTLGIKLEEVDFLKALDLSLKNRLSFYDAGYLYLSRFLRAPLITADKALQKFSS